MSVHKGRNADNARLRNVGAHPKKLEVIFDVQGVRRQVTGKTARALLALVDAGRHGVSAVQVSSWAFRLAAYCHKLRRKYRLNIETIREAHDGGWHGRYVLHTPVSIVTTAA